MKDTAEVTVTLHGFIAIIDANGTVGRISQTPGELDAAHLELYGDFILEVAATVSRIICGCN